MQQIVDNNDESVVDNKAPPPPSSEHGQQTTCLDEATCPFLQQRPHSSSSTDQHNHRKRLGSFNMTKTITGGGSQSTLNTLCSYSRKSRDQYSKDQQQQKSHQQLNAVYNRLYHSDPSTHMLGTASHITDDSEYMSSNYAHIKHSHRHPHFHLRRQSQPDGSLRLMSRNSSSVKSFTSQCYINPEYFYEIRPSRSCDDSKASLIPRKPSQNHIMLLNSELHLLEGLHGEHSQSYPKINYLERRYLLDDDVDGGEEDGYSAVPLEPLMMMRENGGVFVGDEEEGYDDDDDVANSSSETEPSDASEFHENKTSTLDRQKATLEYDAKKSKSKPKALYRAPPMFSETDSYSTVNDEITQLVSKHLSNSIKQLVARRLIEIESYTLPLRRRHSCDSSELSDIVIPDFFNSPSRIKWNFLTGLPDRSRSQSQIYSSDYKTDDDDDEEEVEEEEEVDDEEIAVVQEAEIDEIHKQKSSSLDYKYHAYQQHLMYHQQHIPLWRTSSYGTSSSDNHEVLGNCCGTPHFARPAYFGGETSNSTHDDDIKYNGNRKERDGDDDERVFEFELCTKENCEYLSKSQALANNTNNMEEFEQELHQSNLMNNEKMPNIQTGRGNNANQKNINLKHNKFNKKTKKAKKGKMKENREQKSDVLLWNKIDLNNLMKKDSCNINSVNLKHSSSSSTSSMNAVGNHRKNLKRHQKACDKLFTTSSLTERQQQSLNVTSLILATSSNSTQARIRNDGGIYFSNPDLSSIPQDLRSLNFINNSTQNGNIVASSSHNSNNNNNSCQFINNDLRGNSNTVHSRSRFDSRFNNLNSATNYLLESINSNNIENSNNSFDELMQQQDLRRRLRYINLHGIIRRAQRRARKYLNSFVSRK